jgi:hypothetical protein
MGDFASAIEKLTADIVGGPPGLVLPLKPPLKQDATLQQALNDALNVVKGQIPTFQGAYPNLPGNLEEFSFAVADLTEDVRGHGPANPAYAGFQDTTLMPIGSLAKLVPLYAAHVLRKDARDLATEVSTTSISVLGDLLRQHYRRLGAAVDSGFPTTDDTFPMVEDILAFDANGVVDFKTGGTRWPGATDFIADPDLEDAHNDGTRPAAITGKLFDTTPQLTATILRPQLVDIAFREQLRLMGRWSDNVSASIVAQSLGFPLLWRLMGHCGLFRGQWEILTDPGAGQFRDPGGLFLGIDYVGNSWTMRPKSAPVLGKVSSQIGNARAVAQFMASLANEMIDEDARISIHEILRKNTTFRSPGNLGEATFIGPGFSNATVPWAPDQQLWGFGTIPAESTEIGQKLRSGELACSKIGLDIFATSRVSVCANGLLVRCSRKRLGADRVITAVLVGLFSRFADVNTDGINPYLNAFGQAMANELDGLHPL